MTEQQTRTDAETRAYRPIRRGGGDARLAGGVCAGLGRATGVDPLVYRVATVALVFAGGMGFFAYIAGLLLMPAEDQEAAPVERWSGRRHDAADVLVIFGAIIAAGLVLSLLGGPRGSTLVALVVLALGLLTAQRRGVDIPALLRALPEHVRGRAVASPEGGAAGTAGVPSAGGAADGTPADRPEPGAGGVRGDGLIDLGAYGRRFGTASGAPVPDTDGAPYGPGPEPGVTPRPAPRGRWVGSVFWLAAAGAGAWVMAINASTYGWDGVATIGYAAATALIVLGLGLVVGAWFGRPQGLLGWSVLLAIALVVLPLIGTGAPRTSVRDLVMHWRPATVAQMEQPVRMGVGAGVLSLTAAKLTPGEPVAVDVAMRAGRLQVIVPNAAQVRIDGAVRFGDIRDGGNVLPEHDGHVSATLAPKAASARPPIIRLRIRGTAGDVEVRRAA